MNTALLQVGLRQGAIVVPETLGTIQAKELRPTTAMLVANLSQLGFGVTESLLQALNASTPTFQTKVLEQLREVMGINKNWTPLVKGWDVPTGESRIDHYVTFFYNVFGSKGGTLLPCGHRISKGTFPLERYNGCPFCGTPFEQGEIEHIGQGSVLRVLNLWRQADAEAYFKDLLNSKTALDATQVNSLKLLLSVLPIPLDEVDIAMKETKMLVIDALVEQGKGKDASVFFEMPSDVMRYLWYKKTGFLQIVAYKTIVNRVAKNQQRLLSKFHKTMPNQHGAADNQAKAELKLKYSRAQCRLAAEWLNGLNQPVRIMASNMHPKREMWVRFIRALRLTEYSKRSGMEHLAELLDVFYRKDYPVWQGEVDRARLRTDANRAFTLLKQRPGAFARALFANMLWFGPEPTLQAFREVVHEVPARLLFTLNSYAPSYFDPNGHRAVKPLGGINKMIPNNALLKLYSEEALEEMQAGIADLCMLAVKKRFEAQPTEHNTIYIDPMLYKMPVSIGDRSATVQDLPSALMGTRFPVEGDTVRLFMQWGEGLPAQHLDMDLSCRVVYDQNTEICSYSQLCIRGAKHSGDIQHIPAQVGTAEYIDLDVKELNKLNARFVVFTCNAYSNGSITPNLVVGWMNSKHPMKISKTTGVAYDPSCVQYQVKIDRGLSKGLVFGVLDVKAREIIWLELDFQGQVVQQLNLKGVSALLNKLEAKLSIGTLLALKAEAQDLEVLDTQNPEQPADEVYTASWALNAAAVTQLLVD